MPSDKYIIAINNLNKIIDLAIEAIRKYPPYNMNNDEITHFVNVYSEYKREPSENERKFQNLQSVKQSEDDILVFFNEGHGTCVNEFWNLIASNKIPFKRKNKLKNVLSRKKIKNSFEYDYVIDSMGFFIQEEIISKLELEILNKAISDFELKNKLKRLL
jgi:hypothetical protein